VALLQRPNGMNYEFIQRCGGLGAQTEQDQLPPRNFGLSKNVQKSFACPKFKVQKFIIWEWTTPILEKFRGKI